MPPIGDTARVLKMWREMSDLNQRELADLAGIHYTTISDYETGKTIPQTETIARVTAALGMTPTDREAAESYVRQTWPRLRITKLDETGPPPELTLTSSTAEVLAWRKEIAQTVQDGSRFVSRLLLLLFDLLLSIAEAVVKRTDSKPEPPS